jgi:hypothetical protein
MGVYLVSSVTLHNCVFTADYLPYVTKAMGQTAHIDAKFGLQDSLI